VQVLVCDDDPDVGGFLRTTFELEHWESSLVESGDALLSAIADGAAPDAIVLDQVMPGLTGLETASRLRDGGFTRPIILCSGHLAPELNEEIARLELVPVNKVDLAAVVRIVRAAVGAYQQSAPRG
jgi:DNA-binding response OmpR family regulator